MSLVIMCFAGVSGRGVVFINVSVSVGEGRACVCICVRECLCGFWGFCYECVACDAVGGRVQQLFCFRYLLFYGLLVAAFIVFVVFVTLVIIVIFVAISMIMVIRVGIKNINMLIRVVSSIIYFYFLMSLSLLLYYHYYNYVCVVIGAVIFMTLLLSASIYLLLFLLLLSSPLLLSSLLSPLLLLLLIPPLLVISLVLILLPLLLILPLLPISFFAITLIGESPLIALLVSQRKDKNTLIMATDRTGASVAQRRPWASLPGVTLTPTTPITGDYGRCEPRYRWQTPAHSRIYAVTCIYKNGTNTHRSVCIPRYAYSV